MATKWRVPRIWAEETASIFASGPSMTPEIAEAIRGKTRVIVINDQYKLAPWADILYAADGPWWQLHQERYNVVDKFKGRKVTIYSSRMCIYPEVQYLLNTGESGIDENPECLRTGRNSGYQALHLAYHLGVKKVLLFGFDMREVDGKKHNFGDHPKELCSGISNYSVFIDHFNRSAPEFKKRGIEIVNCTGKSSLKCFTKMKLEEALEGLRNDTRNAAVSA